MTTSQDHKLPGAKAFWDLIVYQRARELQRRVFVLSKDLPKDERFSLTDQVRRASRSIGAQIAEAWGKRDYQKHFISKLSDAESENLETQHWIITSVDAEYLTNEQGAEVFKLSLEVGRMLGSMSLRASEFCRDPDASILREDPVEWFNVLNDPFVFMGNDTDY